MWVKSSVLEQCLDRILASGKPNKACFAITQFAPPGRIFLTNLKMGFAALPTESSFNEVDFLPNLVSPRGLCSALDGKKIGVGTFIQLEILCNG